MSTLDIGFKTTRLMKVFGHERQCTCRHNTHGWIVYIIVSSGRWNVTWILMVEEKLIFEYDKVN
jgi:hypothetical protein